jgi:hypothetical protein
MPNMTTPSELEARQAVFGVYHRFHGKIDDKPAENFLGMDQGANVVVGLRFSPGWGVEAKAFRRLVYPKETILGISAVHAIPGLPMKAQLDIQTFSNLKSYATDDRKSDWFGLISLQSAPLLNRITPVFNVGLDHLSEHTGTALGVSIRVLENLHIQGEYSLLTDKEEADFTNSYSVGLRLLTYGHHFTFIAGNNQEIGPRHFMLGSPSDDLYFGFNILRILDF